jgi:hypothetical protein
MTLHHLFGEGGAMATSNASVGVRTHSPSYQAYQILQQALHMAESLAKGQPNRGRIALTLFRDKVHDFNGR